MVMEAREFLRASGEELPWEARRELLLLMAKALLLFAMSATDIAGPCEVRRAIILEGGIRDLPLGVEARAISQPTSSRKQP